MGWFKKKIKEVEVVGHPAEVNPPAKSPKSKARNESRIASIKEAMAKPRCTGEARKSFESELKRREALKSFWEESN